MVITMFINKRHCQIEWNQTYKKEIKIKMYVLFCFTIRACQVRAPTGATKTDWEVAVDIDTKTC